MTDAAWFPAYGTALLLSAAALARDRKHSERRRSSLAALVWTGGCAVRVGYGVESPAPALAALDLALVVFLVGLCWKARHGWPVLAAFAQSVSAAALIAGLTDSRLQPELPMLVSTVATHVTAALLLAGAWASAPLRIAERGARQLDVSLAFPLRMADRLAHAPNRPGPGGVVATTADHVDVQLRHHVPERADVELFDGPGLRRAKLADDAHRSDRLLEETRSVARVQLVDLTKRFATRNEHEPGPTRVVLQPDLTEAEVDDERRRGF